MWKALDGTSLLSMQDTILRNYGSLIIGPSTMKNEFVKVTVNPNGIVDIIS